MIVSRVIFFAGLCSVFLFIYRVLLRTILHPGKADPSTPRQSPLAGIVYSFTGAMSPSGKESASLHLVSYWAGVAYHAGTFLAFALAAAVLSGTRIPDAAKGILIPLFALAALCGIGLLAKRSLSPGLRKISIPDDYISNGMVTILQLSAAAAMLEARFVPVFIALAGAVLLYLPLGKLRHAVWFFPVRIYLGLFYGRRGTWPARKHAL